MKVKGVMSVVWVMVFAISSISFANQIDPKATKFVPDDLVLRGGLKTLHDQYYASKSHQEQTIIVEMITKNTEPLRFDVLMDIVMFDLRGADRYGQSEFTSPVARLTALKEVAKTGNDKYAPAYLSIVKFDGSVQIRIEASRALGKFKNDDVVNMIINLVRFDLNHPNFREDNEKMFNDNRVLEALVQSMGEIGNPRFFPALLQIVSKRNHREETIQAAWRAMEKLEW
jgi:hypothetical protein